MRFKHVMILSLAVAPLIACSDAEVTASSRPPLAGVRIINGLSDGVVVDVTVITQMAWVPRGVGVVYRAGTQHWPTEAGKELRFRVFPTSTEPEITSQILADQTFTFTAGAKYTLLVTGSATANTVQMQLVSDDVTPIPAQIAIRLVNASGIAIDGHLVPTTTSALNPTPNWSNVSALSAASYIARDTGNVAVRVTAAGSATVLASTAAPRSGTDPAGTPWLPGAGVNVANTRMSAWYFPAVAARPALQGRPPVNAIGASVVFYADRNPADP